MFLTKECDYGIRIIRALVDGTKKTVEDIALEQNIPKKYAYKIIKKLDRAELVRSVRGRGGGYRLSKPLNSFSVADIIATIDTNRYINDCLQDDSECPFKHDPEKPCTVHQELMRIQEMVISQLSALTMDVALLSDADIG